MSIEEHVPDGTFVEAVARLATPKRELLDLGLGQKILVGYDVPTTFGDKKEDEPETIHLSTLTGIVDAYNAKVNQDVPVVIQVTAPHQVRIVAPVVGARKQQFIYVQANAYLPGIESGKFLDLELFILLLQTNFIHTEERERAQKYLGSLTSGLASDIVDDGVTQTVTTKRGLTRAGYEAFINPITLAPFRTFPEITQPESPFVLRTKQVKNADDSLGAQAALYEADGGQWRWEAIQRIGNWLRGQLSDAVILA